MLIDNTIAKMVEEGTNWVSQNQVVKNEGQHSHVSEKKRKEKVTSELESKKIMKKPKKISYHQAANSTINKKARLSQKIVEGSKASSYQNETD